jgi:hypothetical protein
MARGSRSRLHGPAARPALAPFTEGATPETRTHDPLLAASSRLCEQLAKARIEPAQQSREAVEVITSGLPHIAGHLDLQVRMLTGRAIARATALPISEVHADASVRVNDQRSVAPGPPPHRGGGRWGR